MNLERKKIVREDVVLTISLEEAKKLKAWFDANSLIPRGIEVDDFYTLLHQL